MSEGVARTMAGAGMSVGLLRAAVANNQMP